MCLNNCNIEVEENKEGKREKFLTYEDRLEIERCLKEKKKYTLQEIGEKIGKDKFSAFEYGLYYIKQEEESKKRKKKKFVASDWIFMN